MLRSLANAAQRIVSLRAALRHDLMGRVYHKLLADKKYLATYYTRVPSALLLLKLALGGETFPRRWNDLNDLMDFASPIWPVALAPCLWPRPIP